IGLEHLHQPLLPVREGQARGEGEALRGCEHSVEAAIPFRIAGDPIEKEGRCLFRPFPVEDLRDAPHLLVPRHVPDGAELTEALHPGEKSPQIRIFYPCHASLLTLFFPWCAGEAHPCPLRPPRLPPLHRPWVRGGGRLS